jgi:hypothetical protein
MTSTQLQSLENLLTIKICDFVVVNKLRRQSTMSTDICLYSALLCWYRNTTMPSKQITLHNKEIKKYQASRMITAPEAADRILDYRLTVGLKHQKSERRRHQVFEVPTPTTSTK